MRHDEGHELVEPVILPQDDGRLMHARDLDELRLDLAEFDPEAAQLHLIVDPTPKLDVADGSSATASPER